MSARRLAAAAIAATLLTAAAAHAREPSAGRGDLWATVNACDPMAAPGSVGIRVSIPRGRRSPTQWARFRVQFYDAARKAWRPVRAGGDTGFARIGAGRSLVFGGSTFTFTPPAAGARLKLRGVVDVQWRRGIKVLDRAFVRTTSGHGDRSDAQLRVSSAACVITR